MPFYELWPPLNFPTLYLRGRKNHSLSKNSSLHWYCFLTPTVDEYWLDCKQFQRLEFFRYWSLRRPKYCYFSEMKTSATFSRKLRNVLLGIILTSRPVKGRLFLNQENFSVKVLQCLASFTYKEIGKFVSKKRECLLNKRVCKEGYYCRHTPT